MVVFDLGGVMVKLARGWEETFGLAGVRYRPFPQTPEFWWAYRRLEHGHECGVLQEEFYFRGIQELIGGDYTQEELRAGFMAILREEYPGIGAIVAELKARGVRTACLSNTSPIHWPVLTDPARYPSVAALDGRYASHLLGACKPEAAIYHAFEAATGAEPGEILFFDDREANVEERGRAGGGPCISQGRRRRRGRFGRRWRSIWA